MAELNIRDYERRIAGNRVLVTGHTGFTGSWICNWLSLLNCRVLGVSRMPVPNPSLFEETNSTDLLEESVFMDIGETGDELAGVVRQFDPQIIIHLAAQSLVPVGFEDPIDTFRTNTMGTVNILEASRGLDNLKAILCITTDKVYRNREWIWPYRECDELGGDDPYSASKACAELAVTAYRQSFFRDSNTLIATARGGNIIGGGDWSDRRLIPDIVKAIDSGEKLKLRHPEATRPWQHVLCLIHGYFHIINELLGFNNKAAKPWNIGPEETEQISVGDLVNEFVSIWKSIPTTKEPVSFAEHSSLAIDTSRVRNILGWRPNWDMRISIRKTAEWYMDYYKGADARDTVLAQINEYRSSTQQ